MNKRIGWKASNQVIMASYSETITAIKAECATINLDYKSAGDGRITSAVKEEEYLNKLTEGLKRKHPHFTITLPPSRHWYDIRINGIPLNLKISSGGTDNAFNKVAILYTASGTEVVKRNMNYNVFFKALSDLKKKEVRSHMTEYHYLVVNKSDGKILLKSILDIHSYKSNPCNDLQINWANEFAHIDFVTPDLKFKEKFNELIKTVQTSVRQAIAGMKDFAEAEITS